jgi:deoxyribodipyrimidine photo-lyase
MADPPHRAIAWFRRDLRLTDNRVLEAATRAAERVWPVFVADPELLERHRGAPGRTAWFAANLAALDERLGGAGSGLTVLAGPPENVLRDFAASVGADAVYAAADEDPIAVARDTAVAAVVDLRMVDDLRIVAPRELRTHADGPFSVYSPFRRALDTRLAGEREVLTARADSRLDRLAPRPAGTDAPAAFPAPPPPHELPTPGEDAGTGRLRAFLRTDVAAYGADRDRPDLDVTSRLSPYLRVGAISVRAVWRAALNAEARGRERRDRALVRGAQRWRGELAWREFYAHVLAANPRLATESFRPAFDRMAWDGGAAADRLVDAWHEGRTGYPFVDAGMRQLVASGWMHNRARLATASFLAKDIGVDWRRGEAIYLEHLLDADTQQNNGNWQWVAGVGTDPAPYFRVFNPTLQGQKFDPHGTYVRRWVPELAHVPDELVHEPWRAPDPPPDYPSPILDHGEARERALARYAAIAGD